jgi:hypothetical protein
MHRFGIGEAAGFAEDIAEVGQRIRIVRHETDGRAECGLGVLEIAELPVHDAQAVVGLRLAGITGDRLADFVHGALALAALPGDQADHMQGIGLFGIDLQQLSAQFFRTPQVAASIEASRSLQQPRGRARRLRPRLLRVR